MPPPTASSPRADGAPSRPALRHSLPRPLRHAANLTRIRRPPWRRRWPRVPFAAGVPWSGRPPHDAAHGTAGDQRAALRTPRRSPQHLRGRELRSAFGSFMTGVTIVTTAGPTAAPRLHRQQLHLRLDRAAAALICIGKIGGERGGVPAGQGLCRQHPVGVAEGYVRPLRLEAARQVRREVAAGPFGNPLIEGSAAWFDCARYQVIDAGDHIILMGHIEAFSYSDANPLGYARGGYITLGLEQAAVNAASSSSRTVVGAILETTGRLDPDAGCRRPNGLSLPGSGARTAPAAAPRSCMISSRAKESTRHWASSLPSSKIPNAGTMHLLPRRGAASCPRPHGAGRFRRIPWDKLPDDTTRTMLRAMPRSARSAASGSIPATIARAPSSRWTEPLSR
jgi:hypothetical protein